MSPRLYALAADVVLWFHVGIVLFNVFGLVVIPLGAWQGWPFVRIMWWRLLHIVLMAIVMLQAAMGHACFLTLWQAALNESSGEPAAAMPMIQRWVSAVIFWQMPIWVFALIYAAAFVYCLALW